MLLHPDWCMQIRDITFFNLSPAHFKKSSVFSCRSFIPTTCTVVFLGQFKKWTLRPVFKGIWCSTLNNMFHLLCKWPHNMHGKILDSWWSTRHVISLLVWNQNNLKYFSPYIYQDSNFLGGKWLYFLLRVIQTTLSKWEELFCFMIVSFCVNHLFIHKHQLLFGEPGIWVLIISFWTARVFKE